MAFKAKDGRSFGNRQRMAAYDEREPKAEKKQEPEAEDGEQGGEDVSHQDINEVVAEHGPAEKIEMEHDHEGGSHSVTSHHGGKKHHSEHASAEEAHHHAGLAAGIHAGDPTAQEHNMGGMMQEPGMGY